MAQPQLPAATLSASLLLLLLLRSPFAGGATAEGLAATLEAADECTAAAGNEEACGLSALQLRARRRGGLAGSAGTAAEAALEALEQLSGWARERQCRGEELHELSFAVRQRNLEQAKAMALDRSSRASPNYRRWLSWAEVNRLTRSEESLLALKSALGAFPDINIVSETVGGELLRARAPVATWERLLGTAFHIYRHQDSRETMIQPAGDFLLPQEFRPHVEAVLRNHIIDMRPTRMSGVPDVRTSQGQSPRWGYKSFQDLKTAKGRVITPDTLREVYSVGPIAPRGSVLAGQLMNTTQVVFATLGQYWSPSDRTIFEEAFQIPQDNYVQQLDIGDGRSGDQQCREDANDCAEANLDVQYMMAMSPWSKIGYWYVQQPNATGMFNFLTEFLDRYAYSNRAPPQVISISYGMPEFSVQKATLLLFETLAMKLALSGVTILVASGDDGAASFLARRRLHGRSCWSVPLVGLQVSWPASSEWVTAVGASVGAGTGHREIVCQTNATGPAVNGSSPLVTSGGGFSQVLKTPAWQQGHNKNDGRGIPDLSLVGHSYAIVIGGRWLSVDGTSASAPALAGMLSLVNAQLLAEGRPTIGFLNPLLYNASSALIDVTEGDNKCAAAGAPCCGGYEAAPGWDATTGLGVPDFAKLREALLANAP